ncbi:hypothetical protein FDC45_07905 [Clostridium botulinum]|uniref:DUF1192 domain-containing protein n=1 Tax=Clostridium botulinum TaxID=1491 RepID=A0A846JF41_CLOBO|nr:TMEM14 family protein [Clostridium botulinum]ACA54472.1 hypothetical protein CLK_1259 [Clostridium botulinum A3 str. Loch Maree]NFH66281.1 hypothetical protein [Clostridium botulinum]NFJ08784.1 hypothetical protein [Clostridium botulinum]NFK15180.1 hypothetical protein [Clostridium botulinum]NFM95735.1 hypothetical protein [Clostridium botulinum]
MKFNGWNSFEDLARACGYTNSDKDSDNTSETSNNNATNESCNMGCYDIPNGFQSLNPQLFVAIGGILGDILAGSIPSNVQASIGNWLVLVGQAILTFNSQQIYFQQGPGRYFNPCNYNVDNPFCETTSKNTTQNNSSSKDSKNSSKDSKDSNKDSKNSSKSKEKNSNSDGKSSSKNKVDKIEELELRIDQLMSEMERIKNKIEK